MAADNVDAECPREFNSRCNRFNFVYVKLLELDWLSLSLGTLKVRRKRIHAMTA